MLLFRSEEHVERRCQQWRILGGAILFLELQWRLARAWYADRLSLDWWCKTDEEVAALWTELGFTASFWSLPLEVSAMMVTSLLQSFGMKNHEQQTSAVYTSE
jgi:hypothetical protein